MAVSEAVVLLDVQTLCYDTVDHMSCFKYSSKVPRALANNGIMGLIGDMKIPKWKLMLCQEGAYKKVVGLNHNGGKIFFS